MMGGKKKYIVMFGSFTEPFIYVFVLCLSLGKNVDFVSFLPSDLIMNKRIDKVPTLKYIFVYLIKRVLSSR